MKLLPDQTAARAALREQIPSFIRDGVVAGLLVFALGATVIVLSYQSQVADKLDDAYAQLKPQAEYLASQIDVRAHAWLVSPQQTDSPVHKALTERLQNVRGHFKDIGRLFTGRLRDGHIVVLIDTYNPAKGMAGRHYVARPLDPPLPVDSPDLKAIQQSQPYLSDTPLLKGSGHFLGAIIPLSNPDGNVRDFLYLDTDRTLLDADLRHAENVRNLSLLIVGVLAAVTGTGVFSWRSKTYFQQALVTTQLRRNEELFRSTYEMSPVAMYLTDVEGSIIRANNAFCQLIGYSETELCNFRPADYVHVEDLERERSKARELQEHITSQYQAERRYLHHDKSFVWGLVSVAIVRDSDANISHLLIQVVDITERKKAEETLRRSEERLALAANTGEVGIWDCDIRTGQIVWNDVMHAIHQTETAAFNPTFLTQQSFIVPEDREIFAREFQRSLDDLRPLQIEYRITTTKGLVRHIKATAAIFRDEHGTALRAVGTNMDFTQEKNEAEEMIRAKEAALAADKAKGEFLAMMSHEIRTPLNGVLGFVAMLKDTPLDSEQLSYIETMESSGQGLLALVNDILDLSKIEAREIHVETSTFEIRPFLRKIHDQLRASAYSKELNYDIFVDYGVPKTIHTDPLRLGQVLTNILGNAIKFTDRGRVDLHVSAKPNGLFQNNWEWNLVVRDTGQGIPAEAIPKLFKVFYQVDSSATRRHGGTGLGLTISRRLSRLLGGDIKVTSKLGEGSEFHITITAPRDSLTFTPKILASARNEATPSKIQGKRILVVEDNPVNRKLCAIQLRKLGCEAEFAETGLEGVEKAREGNFDAVLMDMQLPDLDGCAATREIRRDEPAETRLSIIALTANAMPEDKKRCLDAGMDDFLSKPLQPDTLAATLSRWT